MSGARVPIFDDPRLVPEEEWAELDDALITGEGTLVDIHYDDGTWQSELDAKTRERSRARATRLVATVSRHRARRFGGGAA